MPLEILLALVVGGIAAIATALHLLGLSAVKPLDEVSASNAWNRHFPDDKINSVLLSHDGRTAIIATQKGKALLWQFGADTVARYLDDFETRRTSKGIVVMTHDPSAPKIHVRLSTAEQAEWAEYLELST